jgi:signal transduction histidine kinase/ligand-binding sensor domain-containing protein/CheY-like chemotaxis protein/HPt (histidine-containing phosphotransfer) domain-containing protein
MRSPGLPFLALVAACALSAGAPGTARADSAAPAAPAAARPLYFEHLTMRQGLSQNTVNSIFQDSRGYIWLGTESGLDRYDGYSIRAYHRQRGNPHALASDYIWKIAEDASGNLWLATDGGGVARWDRRADRFDQFRHDPRRPDSLASDSVRTLIIDSSGQVWVGTEDRGVDILDPKTGTARHLRHHDGDPHSLPSDQVYAIYADRDGRIWIGTDGGLSRYRPASGDFINYAPGRNGSGLSDRQVRAIYQDGAGRMWIGTRSGGLDLFDPRTGTALVYRHRAGDPESLSSDWVRAILEDSAGRFWIATQDGLDLLDPTTDHFTRYGNEPDDPRSLPESEIMSLYQDRGGVLWIGTRGGGASHWNPRTWLFGHYRSAFFHDKVVNAFADDGRGTLWVGTTGGLVEIDTHTGRERLIGRAGPLSMRLSDQRVFSLHYDADGVLWAGTMSGGLDRIELASGKVAVYRSQPGHPESLPANGIMSLFEGRSGTLWIGTFGGGLAALDRRSGRLTRYPYDRTDDTGLSNGRATAIVEDGLGNLWVGTPGEGLNLFVRSSGRFYHFRADNHDPGSLSDDTVYALHADPDGHVWVGTSGGLDEVIGSSDHPERVRFETPPATLRMPSQVIWGIESDREGRLWLSTDDGLVRFSPRTATIRVYHEAQGLQGDEFDFNAHYHGRDGRLYFGGNNGFNGFSPEGVSEHAPPPRVVLTGARLMNRPLPLGSLPRAGHPLELGYDQKLVTFDFAALDYASPADNRYAYRMVGFDSGWTDAGTEHRATYTNLAPGDYTFRVRAANANGTWSPVGLSIPVRVAPAPWNTAAARLGYLAMALLAVASLMWRLRARRQRALRYARELELTVEERTRELEERNQQLLVLSRAKSDFLDRMSHELRTPMNGVVGMTELLARTPQSPTQTRLTQTIRSSAQVLLRIVNDLLDLSRAQAGKIALEALPVDVPRILEECARLFSATTQTKGVRLEVRSPAPAELASQDKTLVGDPFRIRQIVMNLVGNAVKFTEQGTIRVQADIQVCTPERAAVHITISDTGIGMDAATVSRIFEPFTQADESTSRRFGGSGLGLAICRELAELMGGRITVESSPGVGSTFHVDLPLELRAAQPLAAATAASASARGGSRNSVGAICGHVLLVEDEAVNAEVGRGYLEAHGCTVVWAKDGAEALARSATERFDLILMDLNMPGFDGYETATLIRERSSSARRVPIAALTAHSPSQVLERCEAAGIDDVLSKPYTPEDFEQLLRRWIPANPESRVPAQTAGSKQAAGSRASEAAPDSGPTPALPTAEHLSRLDHATVTRLRGSGPQGRTPLYSRLIGLFRTGSSAALGELQEALTAGDLTAARATCHKLKSSAANVGAMAFSEHIRRLEQLCAAGDSTGAWGAFERLRSAHPALISELTALDRRESA